MRRQRVRASLGRRLFILVALPATYCIFAAAATKFGLVEPHGGRSAHGTVLSRRLLQDELDNCTPPAIEDFPPDLLTPEQRRHGGVLLHAALACYLFVLLAIVCDDYFVPSIKLLCDKLEMSEDVAGATFMAAATSSPELFINGVGTFITEGDIGVGTIVGSAVFNVLAVPACCGLFAGKVVDLEVWPLTRDCLMYGITVLLLIATLNDGLVQWYESLGLVSLYLAYIAAMCYNKELSDLARRCCQKKPKLYKPVSSEKTPLLNGEAVKDNLESQTPVEEKSLVIDTDSEKDEEHGLCSWPTDRSCITQLRWLLLWPITALLGVTIPDCRQERWQRFYLLTFLMCILWIGITSYLVAWMITVIGDTLRIPDSVMGLTFLAAGTSVPEAVSSVIVTNQGYGSMGISNSIGSNTFDILLCLGLPWLLKATFLPLVPGQHWVTINSGGMVYSAMSLLSTLVLLYATFALTGFRMNRTVGIVTLLIYIAFLSFASLVELNLFGVVNIPTCPHD
ncbi:sodium/potassium/calcium exchanger 4 isoform X1 [Anabrus simplex]|uniref:sodium/potassium/calcium exchanger 4 isoform X1 n=1 Tax=Anabrus simplex TaxID=316456 RepID=UPI0034DCDD04